MKNLLITLALVVGAAATATATVTYTTSATFNCTNGSLGGSETISGCGSSAVTLDDGLSPDEQITLTFNPLINESVNATVATGAQYGLMVDTCTGAGCVSGAQTITVSAGQLSLALLISESVPDVSPNNSAGSAPITGGIAFDSTSLDIGSYSLSPVTVVGGTDTVVYTIEPSNVFTPPNNGDPLGSQTLNMTITDTNAPEPMSMALMGMGLGVVGLAWRRRRS